MNILISNILIDMENDLKHIRHKIIFNNNDNCFICLNDVDYFIKFDCGCHNFIHTNCIDKNFLTKCLICHKKFTKIDLLTKNNNIFIPDFELVNHIIETKINIVSLNQKIFLFLKSNPNFIGIFFYFIISICFTFGIILPLIILSVFVNIIKYLFHNIVFNDIFFFVLKNILCLILTIGFITFYVNNTNSISSNIINEI